MHLFICSYSILNAQKIENQGGVITKAGELFIEYLASELIVGWSAN